MAVKNREKRYMTKQERELRDLAYEHDVKWAQLARHEDVAEPTISQHLKTLTPSKFKHYKQLILKLSRQRPGKSAI